MFRSCFIAAVLALAPSVALATNCATSPATAPLRGAPSGDAGTSLPVSAPYFQNQVNCDIASLWDVAALPLTSVSGTNTITATATPAIPSYKNGMAFWFTPANDSTGAVTININGQGAKSIVSRKGAALASGALDHTGRYVIVYDGTNFRVLINELELQQVPAPLPRGYISGLEISNNGTDSDNDIDIAKGVARDLADTLDIKNTSTITKQTDFVWAAGDGNGGMLQSANLTGTIDTSGTTVTGHSTTFTSDFKAGDTIYTAAGRCKRITVDPPSDTSMTVESSFSGAETGVTYKRGCKAPNTAYKVIALNKDSDGTFDAAFTTRFGTGASPMVDLPAGYSTFRRIGFVLTDGSTPAVNLQFTYSQDGDYFELVTPVQDKTTSTAATTTVDSRAPPFSVARLLSRIAVDSESSTFQVTSVAQTGLVPPHVSQYVDGSTNINYETSSILDVPVNSASHYVLSLNSGTGLSAGGVNIVDIYLLGWLDKRLP